MEPERKHNDVFAITSRIVRTTDLEEPDPEMVAN